MSQRTSNRSRTVPKKYDDYEINDSEIKKLSDDISDNDTLSETDSDEEFKDFLSSSSTDEESSSLLTVHSTQQETEDPTINNDVESKEPSSFHSELTTVDAIEVENLNTVDPTTTKYTTTDNIVDVESEKTSPLCFELTTVDKRNRECYYCQPNSNKFNNR